MTIKHLTPLLMMAVLLLGACSLLDDDDAPPLEGERISVLELQKTLEPDDAKLQEEGLITPPPWRNEFWPQAGGYPNHSMQNLELGAAPLNVSWTASIGQGSTSKLPLTAQPIVVDGRVFTLDTDSRLSAFDASTGKAIWRTNVAVPEEDDPVISGGIAYSGGAIYVTSGFDEILSVKPDDGEILWRKKIGAPSRAAPTILDGRVFVVTLDNRILALSAVNGEDLWEYSGLDETTSLIGAASPAANADIVIPALSSGEIFALRVENGSVAWSDNLANLRRFGGLESLSDIRALPVIDRGLVIALSFGGRMVAIDERTGNRVWQREIGGDNTPWMAGNHMFLISTENELVALGRENGVIRWVRQLSKSDDGDKVVWKGPILAGGRLMAFSSNGRAIDVNPETGEVLGEWKTGRNIVIAPIVSGGILYLLSEDGTLTAYK